MLDFWCSPVTVRIDLFYPDAELFAAGLDREPLVLDRAVVLGRHLGPGRSLRLGDPILLAKLEQSKKRGQTAKRNPSVAD